MGSESHATRLRQKERADTALSARKAALEARGLDEKSIAKDGVLRHLEAECRKAKKRLAAIEAQQKLNAEITQRKAAGGKKAASKGGKKGKGDKKAKGGKKKG